MATKQKKRVAAQRWTLAEALEKLEPLRDGLSDAIDADDPELWANLRDRPMPEQEVLAAWMMECVPASGANYLERRLAIAEAAEIKQLRAAGGPMPSWYDAQTNRGPFIEALAKGHQQMTNTKANDGTTRSRSTGTGTPRAATVREPEGAFYTHDGKMCSRHKFSTVAYFYSLGIEGEGKRMGSKEFRAFLESNGIDVDTPPWSIDLPNGVTLAFHAAGDTLDASDVKPPTEKPKRASAKPIEKHDAPAKAAVARASGAKKQTPKARAAGKSTAKKSTQRSASKPVDKIVPRNPAAKKST